MAKIKLTKNELKRQREAMERFNRYLPILRLKKQQLQLEISKVHREIERLSSEIEQIRNQVMPWIDVFAEEVHLKDFLVVSVINTTPGNIAGIDIPVFAGVSFESADYDPMQTPLWVDKALQICKQMITLKAQIEVCHTQLHVLKEELRITNQRVNLFEKVKIPEAKENIRVIRIYLGDLQTAEVVRGKIAKAKIEKKETFKVQ
jgi:V/A-type H+-transporting ATPase subunit D